VSRPKKNAAAASKKSRSPDLFLPACLVLILIVSAFVKTRDIPLRDVYSVDEILYNMMATQITANPSDYSARTYCALSKERDPRCQLPDYFEAPLFKHPPIYCMLLSTVKRLGFTTITQANYFSFYLALLVPLVVFFIARKLYDIRTALTAFFLMLIEPVMWMCSVRLWMECTMSLFMVLCLFMFIRAWEDNRWYIPCGIFLGCAALTKYPGALVAPVIVLFAALYKQGLFRQPRFYAIFGVAGLMLLPWVAWNIAAYGNFFSTMRYFHDTAFMGKFLALLKHPALYIGLAVAGAVIWALSRKGYAAGIAAFLERDRGVSAALAAAFLVFLLLQKGVIPGLSDSLVLSKMPPETNIFPSPFAKGPWTFYISQLMRMSPLYIAAFLGCLLIGSRSPGDRLLVIAAVVIMLFYIKWGNYQSRYIVSAIPMLMILCARVFVLAFERVGRLGNAWVRTGARIGLSCLIAYLVLKTGLVDINVAAGFVGERHFVYF